MSLISKASNCGLCEKLSERIKLLKEDLLQVSDCVKSVFENIHLTKRPFPQWLSLKQLVFLSVSHLHHLDSERLSGEVVAQLVLELPEVLLKEERKCGLIMGNRCRSVRGISRKFKCQISTGGAEKQLNSSSDPKDSTERYEWNCFMSGFYCSKWREKYRYFADMSGEKRG